MKFKGYATLFTYNFLVLGVWTALAFTFDRWWIALFSILFMSFPKSLAYHYRICDRCGRRSEPADTEEAAIELAKKAGWSHYSENNTDYCPACKQNK